MATSEGASRVGRLLAPLVAPWFLVSVGVLVGCGPILESPRASRTQVIDEKQRQYELLVAEQHELLSRIHAVGTRLTVVAAPLCTEEVIGIVGLRMATLDAFDPPQQRAASRTLGVRPDFPVVLSIAPGSPAAETGIESGWILESIDSQRVPTVRNAQEAIRRAGSGRLSLRFGTRSGHRELALAPIWSCPYPIALHQRDAVNAFADGRRIYLNSGMVRFASDDDELATVISHEIAHNLLHHSSKKTANTAAGALAGLALDLAAAYGGVNTGGLGTQLGADAGSRAYSQDFEREADYLGLYLAAAAGFDISAAADFWLRMGSNAPGTIDADFESTHPSSPERAANLRLAAFEIEQKIARGDVFLPAGFGRGTPPLDVAAPPPTKSMDPQGARWQRKARSLGRLEGQASSCGVSRALLDEYRSKALDVLEREAPTRAALSDAHASYEAAVEEGARQQTPDDPSCHGVAIEIFNGDFR